MDGELRREEAGTRRTVETGRHRIHLGEEIEEALVEHVGGELHLPITKANIAPRELGTQPSMQLLGQLLEVIFSGRLRLRKQRDPVTPRRLLLLSSRLADRGALRSLVADPCALRLRG